MVGRLVLASWQRLVPTVGLYPKDRCKRISISIAAIVCRMIRNGYRWPTSTGAIRLPVRSGAFQRLRACWEAAGHRLGWLLQAYFRLKSGFGATTLSET
jgi:hypothetical protein